MRRDYDADPVFHMNRIEWTMHSPSETYCGVRNAWVAATRWAPRHLQALPRSTEAEGAEAMSDSKTITKREAVAVLWEYPDANLRGLTIMDGDREVSLAECYADADARIVESLGRAMERSGKR